MIARLLVALPARTLVPLLLIAFSLLAASVNYLAQLRDFGRAVEQVERERLIERLSIDQSRIEAQQGVGDGARERLHVAELGLLAGITHAYLVGEDGVVRASLRRTDIGRPLGVALGDEREEVRAALFAAERTDRAALAVTRVENDLALIGDVPIRAAGRLLVRLDLAGPIAVRQVAGRGELAREAATLFFGASLLLVLLHFMWFRRAARLTATVEAIAGGELEARTRLDGGDEIGAIAAAVDRMAAELQARQAGLQRLSALINRSPVVAMAWRNAPGWPASYVSESISQWGYTVEDFISGAFTYVALIHPEDRARISAQVALHLAEGPDDYRQEYRLRTADGRWIWVDDRTWLTRDAKGAVTHIDGVLLDVTERRIAAEAERLHKERLEAAEAHAHLGSWEFDVASGTGWWSAQMFAMMRLPAQPQPPSPEDFLNRIHPQDREAVAEAMRLMADGGVPEAVTYRTNPQDGEMRWYTPSFYAEYDDGGRPTKFSGTVLDVTAVHAAEREVRELNAELEKRVAERTAQLEAANKELESFSYAVSHDLKAPLRGIDGYSEILLQDYGDQLDDDARLFLGNVRHGVAQMHELIEDMLAYSRMERRSVEARVLNLCQLVETVVESRGGAIDGRRIPIHQRIPPLEVIADREGLTLVLRNLLENALKFSKGRDDAEVELGVHDEEGSVTMWVRDNGVGFDMKYHDRIFEIFQRLHRAEEYPGTGVGLALVKKAVQRMGGDVWAESAPGQGAVFYLRLPSAENRSFM